MPRVEVEDLQPQTEQVTADEFVRQQQSLRDALDRLYELYPPLDGTLLEDISLTSFANNDIVHKLGRRPRGWKIVRDQGFNSEFYAYHNGSQTIANAAGWTTVELDTEEYDHGDNFDPSTDYLFTAPTGGLYTFRGCFQLNSVASGDRIQSRLQDSAATTVYAYGSMFEGSTADNFRSAVACQVILAAGGTVELAGWSEDTTTRS